MRDRRRLSSLILFFTLLYGLAGCTQTNVQPMASGSQALQTLQLPGSVTQDVVIHETFSEQVALNPIPAGVQGQRGIGYVRPEDRTRPISERPQNDEFDLAMPGSFKPFLIVLNNTPDPKTFLITTLLDYRQVPFTLDGRSSLLHLVTIPPTKEVNMPFSLDIPVAGRHDVQVVGFEDPFNITLDMNYRTNIFGNAIGDRVAIAVGNTRTPGRALDVLDTGAAPAAKGPVNLGVMFLHRADGSIQPIPPLQRPFAVVYTDTVPLRTPYPLQIVVSRVEEKQPAREVVRAVVLFLNYRQVTLDGKDVLTMKLAAGEEAVVNTELTLPGERGVHQFQAVYVDDPYANLLEDKQTSPFVFGSVRAALVVQ